MKDVLVIRCQGRLVHGPEVEALEAEVEKQIRMPGTKLIKIKRLALNLAEVNYMDSSGLGLLVRLSGMMRSFGGDARLCEVSTQVLKILDITKLLGTFAVYPTEAEAVEAFTKAPGSAAHNAFTPDVNKILCIEPSVDLLAYVKALLKRAGYEASTTRTLKEAMTLFNATQPRVAICGPGMPALPGAEDALKRFHQSGMKVLMLPADFHITDAGDAGVDLVNKVKQILQG